VERQTGLALCPCDCFAVTVNGAGAEGSDPADTYRDAMGCRQYMLKGLLSYRTKSSSPQDGQWQDAEGRPGGRMQCHDSAVEKEQ
jgi:hypothetical protein